MSLEFLVVAVIHRIGYRRWITSLIYNTCLLHLRESNLIISSQNNLLRNAFTSPWNIAYMHVSKVSIDTILFKVMLCPTYWYISQLVVKIQILFQVRFPETGRVCYCRRLLSLGCVWPSQPSMFSPGNYFLLWSETSD